MPNYHITIHGADREAMADLVRAHRVRVYGQTLTEEDTGYRVGSQTTHPAAILISTGSTFPPTTGMP